MAGQNSQVNILGLEVAFKEEADIPRIREAAKFLEERYDLRKKGMYGMQGKDNVLILVALELADELLQLKNAQAETCNCVKSLLEKIEKSF